MPTEVKVVIDQKTSTFTISGKLSKDPQPSASSGKQLMLATTGGTQETDGEYTYKQGNETFTVPVKVNLNIGITNPGFVKGAKAS